MFSIVSCLGPGWTRNREPMLWPVPASRSDPVPLCVLSLLSSPGALSLVKITNFACLSTLHRFHALIGFVVTVFRCGGFRPRGLRIRVIGARDVAVGGMRLYGFQGAPQQTL